MDYKQFKESVYGPTTPIDGSTGNYLGSISYDVVLPSGVIYALYIDNNADPGYRKSTDYGATWGSFVALKSCSCVFITCWFDGWSDISATSYIHVAYTDSDSDDTFYRSIDTADDTLGTERTIFSGTSTAAGGALSITRARGGNLICATCIDAGAEYDTVKSTDYFASQSSIAEVFEGATQDAVILMPGWAADNQDIMAFFWDASADEISRKLYDDSGDSWSESSISTGMVDYTSSYPHYAAAVDITNSQNVLVAWSAVDTANADLRCWKVTESAITEVTNVVQNSIDDQACASLMIDTKNNFWYVFYAGNSSGTETYPNIMWIYYKMSTDQGATWGSETRISTNYLFFYGMICTSMRSHIIHCSLHAGLFRSIDYHFIHSRASYQLGM